MPIFNITSKPKAVVTEVENTLGGTNITNVSMSGIEIISEDLSLQIASGKIMYLTSFKYVKSSLEVFVNGMRLTPVFDYIELDSYLGFSFVELDYDMSKLLNSSSTILVKYIKF